MVNQYSQNRPPGPRLFAALPQTKVNAIGTRLTTTIDAVLLVLFIYKKYQKDKDLGNATSRDIQYYGSHGFSHRA